MKWHPDRNPGNVEEATEMMKEVRFLNFFWLPRPLNSSNCDRSTSPKRPCSAVPNARKRKLVQKKAYHLPPIKILPLALNARQAHPTMLRACILPTRARHPLQNGIRGNPRPPCGSNQEIQTTVRKAPLALFFPSHFAALPRRPVIPHHRPISM
jgi:hypothetical protein